MPDWRCGPGDRDVPADATDAIGRIGRRSPAISARGAWLTQCGVMDTQESLFGLPPPLATPAPAAGPVPLAERLRPRQIDEVIGQQHLLGPGRPLRVAIESQRLHSMILWGPPGVGKTTLARLVAGSVDAHFIVLSAVLAGVKDIREAVDAAQGERRRGRATVVFVDEVHRFNKAQQDA